MLIFKKIGWFLSVITTLIICCSSLTAENIVLPSNGGILESFTSEYGSEGGYSWIASNLTNGITNEDGWSSTKKPKVAQEFIYSFNKGYNASLTDVVIHGGTAENKYYSKNVEVWVSADGINFTLAGSGVLQKNKRSKVTIALSNTVAKKIKLRVTKGHNKDYWELSEFVVNGDLLYPLTVNSGTGDGEYVAGTVVGITADEAVSGSVFDSWAVESGNPSIADPYSSNGILTMPTEATTVSATYNQSPAWNTSPVLKPNAEAETTYSASLNSDASDPDGDSLTFIKTGGPDWLDVAPDGTLSGTSSNENEGANIFTVTISDGLNPPVSASVQITVDAIVIVNPIASWVDRFDPTLPASEKLAEADPDEDGFTNEHEYLFGLNPTDPSNPRGLSITNIEGSPALTYTYRTDGTASYIIELSDDLTTWTTASVTTISTPSDNGDGTVTVTVDSDLEFATNSKQFFRIQASE